MDLPADPLRGATRVFNLHSCTGAGILHAPAMSASAEPDHERAAHEHQMAIYRTMSPQQRLQQALRMNRSMRALMAAGFRDRHPSWSESDVRRAVAERILHARTG